MSLIWGYPRFADQWPKSGMTCNGELFRLRPWVRPICGGDGLRLPTPTYFDHKINCSPGRWKRHTDLNVSVAIQEGYTQETIGKDFRLNPAFVEEMMGFPIGWTELDP